MRSGAEQKKEPEPGPVPAPSTPQDVHAVILRAHKPGLVMPMQLPYIPAVIHFATTLHQVVARFAVMKRRQALPPPKEPWQT